MKKIITLALFLAVVAGLSGAALSFVFQMTDPVIQEAKIASEKENLVKIYTSGEEFKAVETNLTDYPAIQGVYEASSGGTVKGYVYKCSVVGYGGASTPIQYLIALDQDGTYKGYEVLDKSGETNGFGSKIGDADFKNGIVGKNIGDSIDTISGATISSSAVVSGIEQATAHYEENLK
ncbi:FMN-binding protein [Candidatus Stoquefichus sp. SB1]|uniref:FMN-binding protein n=1 Tax=Candidatus Stoquefichus sp. SB1 TaxID=1658109 RepID=UPI00067F680E|nr:FMN-binding protein [Candidatus Stoquefichus sp. SB1]